MKKTILIMFSMILGLLGSQTVTRAAEITIVPKPMVCKATGGGSFELSAATSLRVVQAELKQSAEIFAQQLATDIGMKLLIKEGKVTKKCVNLSLNADLAAEAYTLKVSPESIEIAGGGVQGVFYALQSLRQLLIASKGQAVVSVPALWIEDSPFFNWRGMMLDCCRHFRTIDEIKRFIDMLSLHKLNIFHWHLTDDQGWRMQVASYPLLTEVGAERAQTVVGHARTSKEYDGKPYGKGLYYTREQMLDVIDYAGKRGIEVIPEIEMPGHALAALAAYPWLGCRGDSYAVSPTFGVFNEVFCAGKESTFEFMEAVLSDVMEIFPSNYVHIGGDECPKTVWKECPHCQKRISENNLANENELQSYFMKRMEAFVKTKGKAIIGWEELLEGGISPTATVMSWKSYEAGIEAAKSGNKVVMVPSKFYYFDYYQSPDTANEPFAIGGLVPVSKVYEFNPYAELNVEEQKAILGVQANLWSEYIPDMKKVEYMVLPRMAALAESGWSHDRKDYDDFLVRVQILRHLYEANGYNYAKHIFNR